ncbi:reverse transcriptase domain-containing protein [Tanacetum coccineum]
MIMTVEPFKGKLTLVPSNLFGIAPPTLSLFPDDPYMKALQAFYTEKSPIPPPIIIPPKNSRIFLPEGLLTTNAVIYQLPIPTSSSEIGETSRNQQSNVMKSQFRCAEENKVTFATGTLTDDALSWWNAYAQPMGIEQANRTTWTELKRLLTNKYCPRTEIRKMEEELYNLIVKGNNLKPYVRRFQELTVLCPNMVPNNDKLLEAFIGGLPRSIEGNVTEH